MPERLALLGGSQLARSPIANAQRCVNYYPEANARDAAVPVTHYQRPGLRAIAQGPVAPVRGVFRTSNGLGYAVIGNEVLAIGPPPGWQLTQIGTIAPGTSICSLTDNSIDTLLVDNSPSGYTWPLASNAFEPFVDPTGSFQGATRVDVIDGFILWNVIGTNQFGSTLDFSLTIDPTYFAGKVNYPDPIQSLIVNHHELVLVGQLTAETWYDAGNTGFPFAELPGADHEHGTIAPYSLAEEDISVFWLGQNKQGQGVVMRARGYECKRISNHPLEVTIRKIKNSVGISDAIGWCFQQDGHVFYVLSFPAGDQTWVFDDSTGEWTQWAWMDQSGGLHRFRGQTFATLYETNVCGDWENGTLYALDPEVYYDNVQGEHNPIPFIRGFPHLQAGLMNLGAEGLDRPVPWAGQRVQVDSFTLDLECGTGSVDLSGNEPQITLRVSLDRGKTFTSSVLQPAGRPGSFLTQPLWRQLGIARDMVFEIQHSIMGEAALNGAWVSAKVLVS